MHEHLAEDEVAYSRQGYLDSVVYVKEHNKTSVKEALCLFVYNSNDVCNKYKEG